MGYHQRQLGDMSYFLFLLIKTHIATLGGAGRKEMDMEIATITHNHILDLPEIWKRDKEIGETRGKYALHFFQ